MIDSEAEPSSGLAEQLELFREAHPVRQVTSSGMEWDFLVGGSGVQTLFLMPGITGKAEDHFALMVALEDEFRVISVGCPNDFSHVPDLMYAAALIMDDQSILEACIVGHGLGAMFAECFMLQYPERTTGLILANMAHPGTIREVMLRAILGIAPFLPREWLNKQLTLGLHHLLQGSLDGEFWAPLLADSVTSLPKTGFEDRIDCILDALPRYPTKRLDIDAWRRRVLILDSDNDPAFTLSERNALRELYPQAVAHELLGAGHFSPYTQPEEFTAVVRSFLNQY